MLMWPFVFVLIVFAFAAYIVLHAKSRYHKLKTDGKRTQGTILDKPLFISRYRKGFSPPDINNGIHLLHYSFTDHRGQKHENASYVSRKEYHAHNIGDEIVVTYEAGNEKNNKPVCSLPRDIRACYLSLMIMAGVIVLMIWMNTMMSMQ